MRPVRLPDGDSGEIDLLLDRAGFPGPRYWLRWALSGFPRRHPVVVRQGLITAPGREVEGGVEIAGPVTISRFLLCTWFMRPGVLTGRELGDWLRGRYPVYLTLEDGRCGVVAPGSTEVVV
jgi:hypothetical protein